MKHIVFLISLVVLFSTHAAAQITHTSSGATDQAANTVLKKAANKMSGTVSFTISLISYDSNKKETMKQKVTVLYNSPRYRVRAGEIELYCDGKSVWQLNKSAREVVVTNLSDDDDDITNPAKLLKNYSKNYKAKFIREEQDGTAIIDLQPHKSKSYHKIRLFIDAKTGLLKKMEQHNFDSSRSEYKISNFKNTTASDTDFVFDAKSYPGIEVVDMR